MANELILRAEPRTIHGKKVKRLRREGLVPGVVYGPVMNDTVSVSVNGREFGRFFNNVVGHSGIFTLEWDGGRQPVLVREVQVDPVRGDHLHIDFFAPNMRQKLRQAVPVTLVHPSDTMVGVLQTVMTEIEVEALPADLPSEIQADISSLVEVGDSIHVSDLSIEGDVEIVTDGEEMVASVAPETVEEEPEEIDEGEEPELVEGEEADAEDSEDGGEEK